MLININKFFSFLKTVSKEYQLHKTVYVEVLGESRRYNLIYHNSHLLYLGIPILTSPQAPKKIITPHKEKYHGITSQNTIPCTLKIFWLSTLSSCKNIYCNANYEISRLSWISIYKAGSLRKFCILQ